MKTDIMSESPITAPTKAVTHPLSIRVDRKISDCAIKAKAFIAHSKACFSDCWAISTRTCTYGCANINICEYVYCLCTYT